MKTLTGAQRLGLIAALVLIWGVSWSIYKVALDYTPPLLFAGLRTLIGGLLLMLFLLPKRGRIRWKENRRVYLISALLNVVLFYGLQTIGLIYMPSGLFTVLVYLQPVLVGLFASLWLEERMTPMKAAGLLLGFLGVVSVSLGGFSGHVAVIGVVLAIATAFSWAFGTVFIKKEGASVDSLWLVAFQCTLGGVVLTLSGSLSESWGDIVWNGAYWTGLLFGVFFGIALSWIIYITLTQAGEASQVASYTFLVPLLSVLVGTLALHEPFSRFLLLGLVLIGSGIYLVNRKAKPKRAAFAG
ncbi:DMT family transporter [Saccharibacillus alkalitolerans]|uniref:DMT family transporter n=1 Tax=Saccharibacillus alkalitolerans TaxID=2705290 RepID=A0ABX0FBR9_9BACL|nr:DMT family transporter [Saccharibacillus alkalitolerans]NGZ77815.1 DMT family transporter [Saccharibacillus alkalitolerans]